MNNKDLDDLKYLLEKYKDDAEIKHKYKLSSMIGFVLFHVKEDLK